ncbi:MAG: hypothetical protein U9N50_02190 [Pseudomonadota bacterium]|nr:hypothetical protein [Pseudomonadota bacterium]
MLITSFFLPIFINHTAPPDAKRIIKGNINSRPDTTCVENEKGSRIFYSKAYGLAAEQLKEGCLV